MSGGAYGYISHKIYDFISQMEDLQHESAQDYRDLTIRISKAYSDLAHAIEWTDSGDTGNTEAFEAINEFLKQIKQIG
jgi:hypothetical protein